MMKKYILIILSLGLVSPMSAWHVAEPFKMVTYDRTTDFPYLKHGKIFTSTFAEATEWQAPVVNYYECTAGKIILSGSDVGLQAVIRREFPNGVDNEFVALHLPRLLSTTLGVDESELMVTKDIARKMVDNRGVMQDIEKNQFTILLESPRAITSGNEWKILLTSVNKNERLTIKVFMGKCAPFEISRHCEYLVSEDNLLGSLAESVEKKNKIVSAFEAEQNGTKPNGSGLNNCYR